MTHVETYVGDRVPEYRSYWSDGADRIGARFSEIKPGIWEVSRNGTRTVIVNHITECDTPALLMMASDKPLCYERASSIGVPVPEHRVATIETVGIAMRFLRETSGPLVVKPAAGTSSGLGITTGVRSRGQLMAAMSLASLYDRNILVERMVPGESYRLLYLAGELIHAVRRRGTRIVGDGRSGVSHLMNSAGLGRFEKEPIFLQAMLAQGHTLASVPADQEELVALGTPVDLFGRKELRTVYDEAALHLCGPALASEGAELVRLLGLELAGVDVITTNPAVSLREASGSLVEVNTTPGVHHHYLGERAAGEHPVAARVLEYLMSRRRAEAAH